MIEAGSGWMSVHTVASNVPGNVLYLTPVVNIVNNGLLATFGVGAAEALFFARNNVSLSYTPYLVADAAGYNSGERFSGKLCDFVVIDVRFCDVWTHLFALYSSTDA